MPSAPGDAPVTLSPLEDERRFLLRSIEDLDAELAAGDIAEADYRLLRDRYVVRAAEVLRALEVEPEHTGETDGPDGPDGPDETVPAPSVARRPGPRRRRLLLWAAMAAFAAGAVVLVVSALSTRLPGQTASGSISLSAGQALARTLAQAGTLENEGKAAQALVLYRQVLSEDPTDEQALAETGWLEFEAGVVSKKPSLLSTGQAEEVKAERADPSAYAPHLYLGSMLLVEGQPAPAAAEYRRFLADDPPVSVEQTAWPYVVRAFGQAGEPVPPTPAGVHG